MTNIGSTITQIASSYKDDEGVEVFYTLTDLPDTDLVSTSTTAAQVLFFNLVFCDFLLALSKRPYVSGRVSKMYGDPLNDAEILRTR